MLQRLLAASACLMIAVPATAQNVAPAADDPAKPQVMMFEIGLENAVDLGVQKLAQRASELYPGALISTDGSAIVQGFVERQRNLWLFMIRVPDLMETNLQMLSWMMRPPSPSQAPPQPVSGGGRVGPAATADPDAMTASPVRGARVFDAETARQEYRSHVKAAVIEAMLENSRALPLGGNDVLTVVATGTSAATAARPLLRSRLLILSVTNADLTAYREGKITREEARRRITETEF